MPRFPDKPKRTEESAHKPVADEGGLVVLPASAEVKVLNPVGSKIYSLLDGHHTQDQIVDAIVEDFDVSEAKAREDLQTFLEQLEQQGMLAPTGMEN